jgi:uncharacterized protein (DUF433 family)
LRAGAALRGETPTNKKPPGYPFDDTDVYKVIEGASYALTVQPDPKLDAYIDGLIAKIAAAQEKDGYLGSWRKWIATSFTTWAISTKPPPRTIRPRVSARCWISRSRARACGGQRDRIAGGPVAGRASGNSTIRLLRQHRDGGHLQDPVDRTTAKRTAQSCDGAFSSVGAILKADWTMAKDYIEQRNGGYFIEGTRISLDSVVYAFLKGESPEGIAESFPALGLEQIFGALTFYTANRDEVDGYLSEGRREFETFRQEARRNNPILYAKLAEARRRSHTPSA